MARVREEETGRLWDTLYEALTPEQRVEWDLLLEVPEGSRISGVGAVAMPPSRASGVVKVAVIKRRSGAFLQVKSL